MRSFTGPLGWSDAPSPVKISILDQIHSNSTPGDDWTHIERWMSTVYRIKMNQTGKRFRLICSCFNTSHPSPKFYAVSNSKDPCVPKPTPRACVQWCVHLQTITVYISIQTKMKYPYDAFCISLGIPKPIWSTILASVSVVGSPWHVLPLSLLVCCVCVDARFSQIMSF